MSEIVELEVGIILDKDIDFYKEMLIKRGFEQTFVCETHDLYWINKSFDELSKMTENQIKKSCVRLRHCVGLGGTRFKGKSGKKSKKANFQNYNIFDNEKGNFEIKVSQIKKFDNLFEKNGWRKVLDTFKVDYQFQIVGMKSAIQLQQIDDIGLVLYYDNPDLYCLPIKEQRKAIIDELCSYGFELNYSMLGIDKLRTLIMGEQLFSENQNG